MTQARGNCLQDMTQAEAGTFRERLIEKLGGEVGIPAEMLESLQEICEKLEKIYAKKNLEQKLSLRDIYRTADILADKHFHRDTVIAAIFRSVLENSICEEEQLIQTYGRQVAAILRSWNKLYSNLRKCPASYYMQKASGRSALFILMAECLALYDDRQNLSEEYQKNLDTACRYCMHAAEENNIHAFLPELQECCFDLQNAPYRQGISEPFQSLLQAHRDGRSEMSSKLYTLKTCGKLIAYNLQNRNISSVYRNLKSKGVSLENKNWKEEFDVRKMPLYDLAMVFSCERGTALQEFITLYKSELHESIQILDFGLTTDEKMNYVLFEDVYGVQYRMFPYSEKEYRHYLFGNSEWEKDNIENVVFTEAERASMICVKKENGDVIRIPNGSTILDYAFYVFPDLGLSVKSAVVDGRPVADLGQVVLNDQNVKICRAMKKSRDLYNQAYPVPKLKWFKLLNSSEAVDKMIKYLSRHPAHLDFYEWEGNDWKEADFIQGATLLDYLVLRYKEDLKKMKCLKNARIQRHGAKMSAEDMSHFFHIAAGDEEDEMDVKALNPGTVIRDGDHIRLTQGGAGGEELHICMHWMIYLNLMEARVCLLSFLEDAKSGETCL